MEKYKLSDGSVMEVAPEHRAMFLIDHPGAVLDTASTPPGKTTSLAGVTPTGGLVDMGSSSVGGFSAQEEISPWQNFQNNISNAFEMVGDVGEFYGVGTGNKSVEEVAKEGNLGAYSGLNIATTLKKKKRTKKEQ